jgi:hypothetical protein
MLPTDAGGGGCCYGLAFTYDPGVTLFLLGGRMLFLLSTILGDVPQIMVENI